MAQHHGQTGVIVESAGFRLLGSLFLARGDDPKPTVLLLHGLPGIEKNMDIAHALRERGYNSAVIHYRGFWGSSGTADLPTSPDDVVAMLDYFESGAHPQVDPNRIVLFGNSFGGWTALMTAARDPRPVGVTVYGGLATFQGLDLPTSDFVPWLPGLTEEEFRAQWDAMPTPLDVMHNIAPRPLLILHGEADEVIPVEQAHALYEAAGENAELRTLQAANHSFVWHRSWLWNEFFAWLQTLDL